MINIKLYDFKIKIQDAKIIKFVVNRVIGLISFNALY